MAIPLNDRHITLDPVRGDPIGENHSRHTLAPSVILRGGGEKIGDERGRVSSWNRRAVPWRTRFRMVFVGGRASDFWIIGLSPRKEGRVAPELKGLISLWEGLRLLFILVSGGMGPERGDAYR